MERLWAPWRIQYINGNRKNTDGGCIFCGKPAAEDPKSELVLLKRETCYAMMNLYPYNSGHLMVAPYEHVQCLTELDDSILAGVMALTRDLLPVMRQVMNPHGFNIGFNVGREAGAGIREHLHLHIVPRWNGDSNIMAVLDDTRVISECLGETYDRIHDELVRSGMASA